MFNCPLAVYCTVCTYTHCRNVLFFHQQAWQNKSRTTRMQAYTLHQLFSTAVFVEISLALQRIHGQLTSLRGEDCQPSGICCKEAPREHKTLFRSAWVPTPLKGRKLHDGVPRICSISYRAVSATAMFLCVSSHKYSHKLVLDQHILHIRYVFSTQVWSMSMYLAIAINRYYFCRFRSGWPKLCRCPLRHTDIMMLWIEWLNCFWLGLRSVKCWPWGKGWTFSHYVTHIKWWIVWTVPLNIARGK